MEVGLEVELAEAGHARMIGSHAFHEVFFSWKLL